jgi:ribosomal protein L37AE/L43A
MNIIVYGAREGGKMIKCPVCQSSRLIRLETTLKCKKCGYFWSRDG